MSIVKCPQCGVYKGSAISVCPQCDHDPFALSRGTPTQPVRPPTLTLPKPAALAPTPTPVPVLVATFQDAPTPQPASPRQVALVALVVAVVLAILARPLAAAGFAVSVGAADVLASVAACAVLALHGQRVLALFGVAVCGVALAALALVDHGTGAIAALQFCLDGCALVLALGPGWRRPASE
ncbi:MAG: hypothetical protein FJ100_09480 [Deltaproteobacteria bacterium]|nr:hypothetical protein [Deltaproteobacteria bacterium]